MKYYLGLDVGGTNFVAGIIDENYKIIEKAHIPAGAAVPRSSHWPRPRRKAAADDR